MRRFVGTYVNIGDNLVCPRSHVDGEMCKVDRQVWMMGSKGKGVFIQTSDYIRRQSTLQNFILFVLCFHNTFLLFDMCSTHTQLWEALFVMDDYWVGSKNWYLMCTIILICHLIGLHNCPEMSSLYSANTFVWE